MILQRRRITWASSDRSSLYPWVSVSLLSLVNSLTLHLKLAPRSSFRTLKVRRKVHYTTTATYKNHALIFDCAAWAAFISIHVFSTNPSSFCMSELQSFITSSALRLLRKLTIPAGRSIRAQIVPDTTRRPSVSSACCALRSRREFRRARVIRV